MGMRECANRLQDLLSRANESLTDYDRETLEAAIKLLQQQADIEEEPKCRMADPRKSSKRAG